MPAIFARNAFLTTALPYLVYAQLEHGIRRAGCNTNIALPKGFRSPDPNPATLNPKLPKTLRAWLPSGSRMMGFMVSEELIGLILLKASRIFQGSKIGRFTGNSLYLQFSSHYPLVSIGGTQSRVPGKGCRDKTAHPKPYKPKPRPPALRPSKSPRLLAVRR